MDLGQAELGEQLYRRVLAADSKHGDAAYNLALLVQDYRTEEGSREAAALYRIAVLADPTRWDAWANMASALSDVGEEPLAAIRAFQRAIVQLETTREGGGGGTEDTAAMDGYLAKLYYGMGTSLAKLTEEQCAELATEPGSLLVGVDGAGRTTAGAGAGAELCVENAQNALRAALELDPDHAQAEHMLAAILHGAEGEGPALTKASPAFVTALFDDFSDSFETKLAALQYKVPELVGEAVAALSRKRGYPFSAALDAGCGTGLAGPYLRRVVSGALIGADLSTKMLEKAADLRGEDGSRVYDALLSKDLLALTRSDLVAADRGGRSRGSTQGVDLIAAADVLVYFGELTELLHGFASLAAAGGSLVFSCERATDEDWKLLPSGRFAHSREYVTSVARGAGFQLMSYREIVPRIEQGQPVAGHLFVFVRN